MRKKTIIPQVASEDVELSRELCEALDGKKSYSVGLIEQYLEKHPPILDHTNEPEFFIGQALVKVLDELKISDRRLPERITEAFGLNGRYDINHDFDHIVSRALGTKAFYELNEEKPPKKKFFMDMAMQHLKEEGLVNGLDDETIINRIKESQKRLKK